MRRSLSLISAAALALAPLSTGPATAQSSVRVAMGGESQSLSLPRGRSAAIDLPVDARDVIVSNPAVAEAMLHSPRRITVVGIAPGETDAVFLDASGRAILNLSIRVDAGVGALSDTIARLLPGSSIRAEAVNESIILTGTAPTPAEADRAVQIARQFVSDPERVLNMIGVSGADQVTLRVRVVEVQRSALKQLGFSTDALTNNGIHSYGFSRGNTWGVNGGSMGGGDLCFNQDSVRQTNHSNTATGVNSSTGSASSSNQVDWTSNFPSAETLFDANGNPVVVLGQNTATRVGGGVGGSGSATSATNTISNVIENVASTIYSTATGSNINACFQAFERVGLIRTLAEPNLTAMNGENASFLAGGEFPVPVGRDQQGNILVEFKPYGVGLSFRPIVLSGGRISLQLSTEVSELSNQGALTLGTGPTALTLPGLNVRRAQTSVELPSG
ncbi:MAG: type II and III secretion system protein family protein, partial [Brevundimonas sp.]